MRQVTRGQGHGKHSRPSPVHAVQHPRDIALDAARRPWPGNLAAICLAHLARRLENLRVPRLFAWPQDSEDERAIEYLAGLKRLQELRLDGCGDLALSHVARIESLTRLNFEGGNATDEGLRYLLKLPSLRQLDMRPSRTTSMALDALRKAHPGIQVRAG